MPIAAYLRPKSLADVMRRHHLIDICRTLVRFAVARMKDAQLQEVASSMTLTTLLSLVPLLAVSLAVFAAFPSFESTRQALEDAIFNSFLPPQYSETILEYLRSFTSHASGLGAFGIAGLSLTGLLLIDKFFVTVNRIFKVREFRPWSQRAMIYWAMLTLGPLVIALSISISTQAMRMAAGVVEAEAGAIPMWVLTLIQLAVQAVGYGVLFKYVPNCRVPFSHALTGGLAVALIGLVVRECFEIYVTKGTLSSIYGAFVAFPVFLLWLYVTWFLVFSGAAITATIPLLTSGRFADSYRLGNEFLTGVALLRVLVAARASGNPTVPADVLANEVDAYPQLVERILTQLSSAGYCGEIRPSARRKESSWALLCDPKEKTLRDAFETLLVDPENTLVIPRRIGQRREEGVLFDWYRTLMNDSTVNAPLTSLLSTPEEVLGEAAAPSEEKKPDANV